MKAATALKLHKFADATVFYAQCQKLATWAAIPKHYKDGVALVDAIELEKALLDLEPALSNLKAAKEALYQALNVEELTP